MPIRLIAPSELLVRDLPEYLAARNHKFVSKGDFVWIYADTRSNPDTPEPVVKGDDRLSKH